MSDIHAGKPCLLPLRGAIQHYAWGGTQFIPALLGLTNPDRELFAELWLGAHPKAPAEVVLDQTPVGLDTWIANAPEWYLGATVIRRFGDQLPYLLKVLDARQMLSIQVHPSGQEAEAGYARENRAGIPLSAPERSYRDANHKPEVHVALTDFWLLHGFRPLDEVEEVLTAVPEFRDLKPQGLDIQVLYEQIMRMPQSRVDRILNPLLERLYSAYQSGRLDEDTPDFWAAQAAVEFPLPDSHRDRGIFSLYLLNLLHLRPGEGTFQDAGILHAYLEGTNIELMANSDNVLRGGLTPKHIDVEELLKVVRFETGHPEVLRGDALSSTERVYRTPAPNFQLSCIEIAPGDVHESGEGHGPDTCIVLESTATVTMADQTRLFRAGEAFFIPAELKYGIQASESRVTLYRATVPSVLSTQTTD